MQEIGALLKKERQEKGISLEEISRKTKIQVRYLQSLEEGDFSCFAGKVYIKGALRNYAESVGINATELISYYERISGEKELKEKSEELNHEKRNGLFHGKEKRSFPVVALIWVILLAVVIGGSIWYRSQGSSNGEQRIPFERVLNREQEEESVAEPEETIILPEIEDEMENIGEEPEPEDRPEIVQLSSGDREAVYLLKGVEQPEISIHFTAKCWVEITQDGLFVEQNTYYRGDVKTLPARGRETKIRLGYPPGARLEVNGLQLNDWKEISNPFNVFIRME